MSDKRPFNPETPPPPRWGDAEYHGPIERHPIRAMFKRIGIAILVLLGLTAFLAFFVFWYGAALARGER